MHPKAESACNHLHIASGKALASLCLIYAAVLEVGLLTLPSPDKQIQDPWFTLMEILILAIAPAMVAFTVGIHSAASAERKPLALIGVIFMSMCAALTSSVHFAILTLSRQPEMAATAWAGLVFSFTWPSVVYALDILAWDVFFPLGALFAAFAVPGTGRRRWVRQLLYASSALAFLGLLGIPLANMNIRNIGVIGYVVLFPMAAALYSSTFKPSGTQGAD